MEIERHNKLPSIYVLLYALAWAGGTVAYTPFITVLLPAKISLIAGVDTGIVWTAYITIFGAIAASMSAILFGYLSDITLNRPIWICIGLALACALLIATSAINTFTSLLTLIIFWQFALNMMLAPLAAYAADNIPDGQKGFLGGLLAFAPGIGALSATIVTYPGLASAQGRLFLVCAIVIVLILPVVFWGRKFNFEKLKLAPKNGSGSTSLRSIAIKMWFARLAIQISEAALFSYLYFWLKSIDPSISDSQTARIFTIAMVLSAPLALITGRWADRSSRPIFLLAILGAVASLSLLSMALSPNTTFALFSYGVFGTISSAFLALHTAQTLSILPTPERRGRDLGIFNLTNTLPSIILPVITLALVPRFGFTTLFIVLSFLAASGSLVLLSVKIARDETSG